MDGGNDKKKKKKKNNQIFAHKIPFLNFGPTFSKEKKSFTLGAAIPCSNKFVNRN
jgi:hypothetical protein